VRGKVISDKRSAMPLRKHSQQIPTMNLTKLNEVGSPLAGNGKLHEK
jgi:hypothetical protein